MTSTIAAQRAHPRRVARIFFVGSWLTLTLLSGMQAAVAKPSQEQANCTAAFQTGMRVDGSFFKNAGQCIREIKKGNPVYYPTVDIGAGFFSGFPFRDAAGNPLFGHSLWFAGFGMPPNLRLTFDYQYPSGATARVTVVTNSTGRFFVQMPGAEAYNDGVLLTWGDHPDAGGAIRYAVPCSITGNGRAVSTLSTRFGRYDVPRETTLTACPDN